MRYWLVQFRRAKGLLQKDVAALSDISRSHYGDIEQGRRDPSGKVAKRLADTLGFDMNLFFAENGRKMRRDKPA